MTEEVIVRFIATGRRETLPDGSVVIHGARILAPERAAGQVRDVIVWSNGGVYLGPVVNAEHCSEPVWDGSYRMLCGRVVVDGACGRHGMVR